MWKKNPTKSTTNTNFAIFKLVWRRRWASTSGERKGVMRGSIALVYSFLIRQTAIINSPLEFGYNYLMIFVFVFVIIFLSTAASDFSVKKKIHRMHVQVVYTRHSIDSNLNLPNRIPLTVQSLYIRFVSKSFVSLSLISRLSFAIYLCISRNKNTEKLTCRHEWR